MNFQKVIAKPLKKAFGKNFLKVFRKEKSNQ